MSLFLSKSPKPYDISLAVNRLTALQKTRNVALVPSVNQTLIEDDRIGEDSLIIAMPVSADAASENLYFTVSKGQVVFHHQNLLTERIFKMGIIG